MTAAPAAPATRGPAARGSGPKGNATWLPLPGAGGEAECLMAILSRRQRPAVTTSGHSPQNVGYVEAEGLYTAPLIRGEKMLGFHL